MLAIAGIPRFRQYDPRLFHKPPAFALAARQNHANCGWNENQEASNMNRLLRFFVFGTLLAPMASVAWGQLVDQTLAPNTAKVGVAKSMQTEIGAGRGDAMTPTSSIFLIERDPFRSVRRGRQLFQRKFTSLQGRGSGPDDGTGDINSNNAIGAGVADSCSSCHGRPKGSAGSGGDVATRPDSRDAPHLFGIGLKEMLADEITFDLRAIRDATVAKAIAKRRTITATLTSKGISYGTITSNSAGALDMSQIQGIDPDLRVKPFFAEGSMASLREFVSTAFHNELGMNTNDPDLIAASAGARIVTPAGMVLDGTKDKIQPLPTPNPGTGNEIDTALVDHMEFYLLNYFKPGHDKQTATTDRGREVFQRIGCASCHVANLMINRDRRVADLDTVYDPIRGNFNTLFATATPLVSVVSDGTAYPPLVQPAYNPFLVTDIYTDFKRHDLGPNFYERNYDGTTQTVFLTRPLWGVGSTGPYGHDGRSISLDAVILRHGGEAQKSRDAYAALPSGRSAALLTFLNSLVLFPPDDTASTLDPGNPATPGFPQFGHGSIKLTVLFDDPTDVE
jgi:Di-haem oxidoreductase, putative peroxidase